MFKYVPPEKRGDARHQHRPPGAWRKTSEQPLRAADNVPPVGSSLTVQRQKSEEPPRRKISNLPFQERLMNFARRKSGISDDIAHGLASENGVDIYHEVINDKPPTIQEKLINRYKGNIDQTRIDEWVTRWRKHWNNDDYYRSNGHLDARKLVKDSIKYHLYKYFNWRTVGAGAYMTGDATGLAISATLDPDLTLKIFQGKSPTSKQDGRDFVDDKSIFRLFKQLGNQAIIRNTSDKQKLTSLGPSDLYAIRYNEHTHKDKRKKYASRQIHPVKDWNKETYHSTQTIGNIILQGRPENLADIQEKIEGLLLPQDLAKRNEIKNYKHEHIDKKIDPNRHHYILIWQRRSGEKPGGAHPELDSHPGVVTKIIEAILMKYPDNAIILLGDQIIEDSALTKLKNDDGTSPIIQLGQFWERHKGIFSAREDQNYLIKLLADENDAVSIGMRSGSLEASALLGVNTIYIDDYGNAAEGRMEMLAGTAAYGRKVTFRDRGDTKSSKLEKKREGPLANYKRVATRNLLGEKAHRRLDILNNLATSIQNYENNVDRASTSNPLDRNEEILKIIAELEATKMKRHFFHLKNEHSIRHKHESAIQKIIANTTNTIKGKRSHISQENMVNLLRSINEEIENSLLSKQEIKQIVFLTEYLRKQARRFKSSAATDEDSASNPSPDTSPPLSPAGPVKRFFSN